MNLSGPMTTSLLTYLGSFSLRLFKLFKYANASRTTIVVLPTPGAEEVGAVLRECKMKSR